MHTVTCRADGEGQIQYELQKEENEAFGFRLDGSVVSIMLCVILGYCTQHI